MTSRYEKRLREKALLKKVSQFNKRAVQKKLLVKPQNKKPNLRRETKMQFTITSVDCAPDDLYDQTPIVIDLIREIPGSDRPDYWIGQCHKPITWIVDNIAKKIDYVVLAARLAGTSIDFGAEHLPINLAYVMDQSLLKDRKLDFEKTDYVATVFATETSGGKPAKKLNHIQSGNIARGFGKGK